MGRLLSLCRYSNRQGGGTCLQQFTADYCLVFRLAFYLVSVVTHGRSPYEGSIISDPLTRDQSIAFSNLTA